MNRTKRAQTICFLKKLSSHGGLFRMLAIGILVADRFLYYVRVYARKGARRYAFAAFVAMSFAMESSFSYPEISEGESPAVETLDERAAPDSDITLAQGPEIEYDSLEILKDEDLLEGCGEPVSACEEEVDRYSLDEILNENTQSLLPEPEPEGETPGQAQTKSVRSFDSQDWRLVLINKQHPIPEDYTFTLEKIKTPNGGIQCDGRVMEDLFAMLQAADAENINLAICSHYRDLNRQEVLFNRKIKTYMKKGMSYMEAYQVSSRTVTVPGASEHQIGLAMDIVSDNYTVLEEGFADTDAGIWLKEHCAEYGFILRYPQGKEAITGIQFEPWHFRYVGREAAQVIMAEGICLEEFWQKYVES